MSRRSHWCETCHGHTGPGSPCAEDEPEHERDPDADRDEQIDRELTEETGDE